MLPLAAGHPKWDRPSVGRTVREGQWVAGASLLAVGTVEIPEARPMTPSHALCVGQLGGGGECREGPTQSRGSCCGIGPSLDWPTLIWAAKRPFPLTLPLHLSSTQSLQAGNFPGGDQPRTSPRPGASHVLSGKHGFSPQEGSDEGWSAPEQPGRLPALPVSPGAWRLIPMIGPKGGGPHSL